MRTRASAIRQMAAAVVALAASTGACGGGGGQSRPPNCLEVAPCGGDVVGTWSFLGACADVEALSAQESCPGAAFNAFGVAITGTFTLNADSSYTASNWHEAFVSIQTVPLSCSGTASCAQSNRTDNETMSGSTINVTTTCTGTSVCTCLTRGTFTVSSDAGSWTTVGTDLTMYGAATSTSLSYCVEGDRLHLIQMASTLTGQTTTVSDIVAVRSQ
jgi:hypothetical protein